jgi:hypothetical protein
MLGWVGIDWIDLAQDRDWWEAFVNTVMNGFHKMLRSSRVAAKQMSSQERLSFMELVLKSTALQRNVM